MGSFSHVSMVTKQITYKSFPNFKTKSSHYNLRREGKTRKVTATKIFSVISFAKSQLKA